MNIEFTVNNGAAEVVGSPHIVVDSVALGLGILHGIRRSTLFGKMNDRIWLFFFDQLDQLVVVFGHIEVDKLDLLAGDFLPGFAADL